MNEWTLKIHKKSNDKEGILLVNIEAYQTIFYQKLTTFRLNDRSSYFYLQRKLINGNQREQLQLKKVWHFFKFSLFHLKCIRRNLIRVQESKLSIINKPTQINLLIQRISKSFEGCRYQKRLFYWLAALIKANKYMFIIIYISLMPNNFKTFIVLSVIFLVSIAADSSCQKGQIKIQNKCIDCRLFLNTIPDNNFIAGQNHCLCSQQFQWSSSQLECVPTKHHETTSVQVKDFNSQNDQLLPSRLLQGTCDATKGFVLSSSVCVNCRVIPFGLGAAIASTRCTCMASFRSSSSSASCSCPYGTYYDHKARICMSCSFYTFSTGLAISSCISCNALPFANSRNGCINCLTLPNNGGSASCCATGYKFDYTLGTCICDNSKGYAVGSNGVCSACSGGDTNCKSCVNTYVYNNYFCIHGSLIPNFDLVKFACSTGFTFKTNFFTGQIISCACSKAAQNFVSSGTCTSCSKATSASNCQSCSATAGFASGPVDCIYCPSAAFSTGTATANGCSCNPNYYWNINTGLCQCDFVLGLIGGSTSTCTNCSSIANTAQMVYPDACSCISGYRWDGPSKSCVCDLSSPTAFTSNGVCYDCANIQGSAGVLASDKISCTCINSFFWNYGLNKCQCDSKQNFAVYNGQCSDCLLNPSSVGIAYNQQCLCQNGYTWNAASGTCSCPAGNVLVGIKCTPCSSMTTPADCNTCNAAKGYASQNGVCSLCSSQSLVTGTTVTNGKCTCPAKMTWVARIGGCACDWSASPNQVTKIDSTGAYTCFDVQYFWSNGSPACGWSFLIYSTTNNVCTDARTDPNGAVDSSGKFNCKAGYYWSEASFPFRCVPGGLAGSYYAKGNGGAAPTYSLCTSLSTTTLQQACASCDTNQGFLLIPGLNICIYCPSVSGASGVATLTSCICNSGYWNPFTVSCDTKVTCAAGTLYNPSSLKCDICDAVYSVTSGGKCVSCQADKNSVGFASTSTACACKASFTWSSSSSTCSNSASCNLASSILINGACFSCPSTNGGTGASNGTSACSCNPGYVWTPTASGGNCNCNSATNTILGDGTCFPCPKDSNNSGVPNPAGGCLCNNNYAWDSNKKSCICDQTVSGYVTPSGLCFRCLSTVDPKFNGTIVNGGCYCKNYYNFISSDTGGSCKCESPGQILANGDCLSCPTNENTTGAIKSSQCLCYNNYVWSSTLNTCICDQTVYSYITGSGYCFTCSSTTDPNFNNAVLNDECTCKNNFAFVSTNTGGSCQCPSPNVVTNGICSQCPITANTTGDLNPQGGCECKNNYIWSDSANACLCDSSVEAYITPSGSCWLCTPDVDHFDGTIAANGVCRCLLGFTYVANNTGGKCSCLPSTSSFIMSTGQCFTCPSDAKTTGLPDGKGGCGCKGTLVWNATRRICACGGSSVALTNGSCFACGSPNTNTKNTVTNGICDCVSSSLVWNSNGYCDCGTTSAMIVKGNSFTCKVCGSNIRAKRKFNSTSCTCSSSILVWNSLTSQCDCGLTSVLVGSKCIPCGPAINANGLNVSNPSSCNCILPSMVWKINSCVCGANQVIFNINGVAKCVTCDISIKAIGKSTQTACKCNTLFKWVPNVGCACVNSNAIVNIINNAPRCIICNSDTYSSGPVSNGNGCVCLGSLIWNSKTLTCGCSPAAISFNGTYFCSTCSTKTFSKTPVINITNCTCASSVVIWYPEGYCACPSRQTSVVVGSGSSLKCVVCDGSIYSNGKSSPTDNKCSCVSQILTYNSGICDCGAGKAMMIQGLSNFQCVTCNNATAFTKAKIGPQQCSCLSTALVWSSISGTCLCSDSNQIIIGSGSTAKCSACVGQYTTIPKTATTCSCAGTDLVFIPSKTTAGACACKASQILTPIFSCQACPTTTAITTPYECTCAKDFYWDGFTLSCKACSGVANANPSGGNIFACSCKAGFIWDVMTLACIPKCTTGDSTCMNCNILYTTGAPAAAATTTQSLTGSATILKFLSVAFTNYASIKSYQCPCNPGFIWDSIRLRCFDFNLK